MSPETRSVLPDPVSGAAAWARARFGGPGSFRAAVRLLGARRGLARGSDIDVALVVDGLTWDERRDAQRVAPEHGRRLRRADVDVLRADLSRAQVVVETVRKLFVAEGFASSRPVT